MKTIHVISSVLFLFAAAGLCACGDDGAGGAGGPDAARSVDAALDVDASSGSDAANPVEPNIVVSAAEVEVVEGQTASFTVALDRAPGRAVTVTISADDAEAASVAPTSLSFDDGDFSVAQSVIITGVEDDDALNEQVTLTLSATDLQDVSVAVSVVDDEAPRLLVTGAPDQLEEGQSVAVDVVLSADPGAEVTVTVDSSDDTAVSADSTSLAFSSANFDTAQTVTLTAVADADADSELVTISFASAVVAGDSVAVVTVDDEQAIVLSRNTPLMLGAGASGSFEVTLAGRPSDDVTVTVTSGSESAATVDTDSLVFTPDNYDSAQTVTVTAGSMAGNTAITLSADGLSDASVIVLITI
ncbi:MAG: hypothetical protein Tsb0020_24090 [Haliangiales bacterium]